MTTPIFKHRRIAFTTPIPYGDFLQRHLESAGAEALWVPTLTIQRSDRTRTNVKDALNSYLETASGIAFTSRNGIHAVAEVLSSQVPQLPKLKTPFYLAALGRDRELLPSLGSLWQHPHSKVIYPDISTPQALVTHLGNGKGRSLLCPVPHVIGLPEPDVVPNFLTALEKANWRSHRVNAYETAWGGRDCGSLLSNHELTSRIDALIFTSTAEIQGLLKSLDMLGVDPIDRLQQMIIAAHGPVTAKGAQSLGIEVQVVSQNSESFLGVLQALHRFWNE